MKPAILFSVLLFLHTTLAFGEARSAPAETPSGPPPHRPDLAPGAPSIAERENLPVNRRPALFVFLNIRELADDHYGEEQIAELRKNLFSGIHSVDGLYNHSSFGQLRFLEEDVLIPEPVTVEPEEDCGAAARTSYRNQARDILLERGIDPSAYLHQFYILPSGRVTNSGCRFSPRAFMGRFGSTRSMTAHAAVFGTFTLVHEMGHNMGFGHAQSDLENDGEMTTRYGDASCIMGSSTGLKGFNAPHADQAGWLDALPQETRITLTEPGLHAFTLLPYGRDPFREPGTQVVRVPRRGDPEQFYYFSTREATGVDANLREEFARGLSIHYASRGSGVTRWIQVLEEGEVFTDEEGELHVRIVRRDESGLTIEIAYRR